jgi:hypothetical protein
MTRKCCKCCFADRLDHQKRSAVIPGLKRLASGTTYGGSPSGCPLMSKRREAREATTTNGPRSSTPRPRPQWRLLLGANIKASAHFHLHLIFTSICISA